MKAKKVSEEKMKELEWYLSFVEEINIHKITWLYY